MPKIIKILGMDNRKDYAIVHVVLEDGTEATTYIGGDCEVFFHKGQIKAYIKRSKNLTK